MNLVVWTKTPRSKVLTALSAALPKDETGFDVEVYNDVEKIPPGAFVLALGSEPLATLGAMGVARKKSTITSMRGTPIQAGPQQILVSYSPGISEVDHGYYIDLLCDARTAVRAALSGTYAPVIGTYEYVPDLSATIAAIKEQYEVTGKPVDVAFDTETIGADPFHLGDETRPPARFVCWQVSHRVGHAAIVYFQSKVEYEQKLDACLHEQLKWLLTTPMVSLRCANGKFDMMWVWTHARGLECTNFKFDTTLVGSLLDENRSNGLKVHAKIYTDLGGYEDGLEDKYDKGRMDLVPKEDLQTYAGGDTDAELQVSTAMKAEILKQPALAGFYVNVLHPAARAFEIIERGGVFIDMEAYKQLELDLRVEIDRCSQEAVSVLGGRLFAKHRDETKAGGINLTKARLISDFMFSPTGLNLKPKMVTEKTGKPSTSMDHLEMFKGHPEAGPFVKALGAYSSATKMLSTYVLGFQKHIRHDGRMHPSYFLFKGNRDEDEGGADTGRLSARDPAFQTIPKHTLWGKRIRRVFAAPPGFLVNERDYSQGELRVVACIANELQMIAAYLAGMDLHCKTGAGLVGMRYEDLIALEETDPDKYDKIRTPAKPANFGLLYGQFPEGFRDYAESNYGVVLTLAEATIIREKFFAMYPGLIQYHTKYKANAHRYGQVVSPLGRVRHLPLINASNKVTQMSMERKAINSPVQSTLSDMMIWALGLEAAEGGFKVAPCFGVIHDAAYDYVPEDNYESIVKHKKEIMENLPFEKVGWKPQLKFPADCKVGKNMGDLKKVKFSK